MNETNWSNSTLAIELYSNLPSGWEEFFNDPKVKEEINSISNFLELNKSQYDYAPKLCDVFKAFHKTPLNSIKAVICGQDCYHTKDAGTNSPVAIGLAFAINPNVKSIQPSLINIYKKLRMEGYSVNEIGNNLEQWANKGVFLINASLTVNVGDANSHSQVWTDFTKLLFNYIGNKLTKSVFILWGAFAQKYAKYIKGGSKCITGIHPSPLSAYRGFFGKDYFTECNKILLKEWEIEPVDWNIY